MRAQVERVRDRSLEELEHAKKVRVLATRRHLWPSSTRKTLQQHEQRGDDGVSDSCCREIGSCVARFGALGREANVRSALNGADDTRYGSTR